VYLVLLLLVVVSGTFLIVFSYASLESVDEEGQPEDYASRVQTLLAGADPEQGPLLIRQFECAACHIDAVAVGIAPSFEGLGQRAAVQREPLSAAEYIYESIIHPQAFVVEGFAGAMPQNYAQRLSDRQLGDLIAYLLEL
jgi:mono/diheme cytochrome c family protein